MFAEFSEFPASARIWVYQSSRIFTPEETLLINNKGAEFAESWTAHQVNLKAWCGVFKDCFLVFAVDESVNDASGCSIDTKVHFIQQLGKEFHADFLNRMNIAYLENSRLRVVPFVEFSKLIDSGKVTGDTIVFNNLVSTMSEFQNNWEIPLKLSWHFKLLKPAGS